jgi:hypothetical protein
MVHPLTRLVPFLALSLVAMPTALRAQGTLTPPGAPAPTQKSLQELWNALQAQQAQITSLQQQNQLLLYNSQAQSWTVTRVDGGGQVGTHVSFAYGPNGLPAIAYYDLTNRDLKFVVHNGATWGTPVVLDSLGDVGEYPSLAFGPTGHPAVAYYDRTNADLKIATYNGSVWDVRLVSTAGDVGQYASLAYAPDGRPTVAYLDATNNDLIFARFNGINYNRTIVDSAGSTGYHPSLAYGPDGQPSIAYLRIDTADLRFARFDGTTWSPETVISTGAVGYHPSLAFAPSGIATIAYRGEYGDLFFIGSSPFTVGGWVPPSALGHQISRLSLAYGPDGQPAIACYDEGLRYIRQTGAAWTAPVLVDQVGGINCESLSLAFGPDGHPRSLTGPMLAFCKMSCGLLAPAFSAARVQHRCLEVSSRSKELPLPCIPTA